MRLSSFLLGSAVGASAVWLLNNRNHPLVNMMKLVSKQSKGTAVQKDAQSSNAITNHKSREENHSIIQSIIAQDPELKKEFEDITKEAALHQPASAKLQPTTQH